MKLTGAEILIQEWEVLNPHGSDETRPNLPSRCLLGSVLNPHGSDETNRQFVFTLFQISFLTHTVQMKPRMGLRRGVGGNYLYIPHGSDETTNRISITLKTGDLYIPHGSDETKAYVVY